MSMMDDDDFAALPRPEARELRDDEVDARFRELTADLPDPDGPAVRPSGPRDWPSTPEVEALEEAESHFTPPVPPPLTAGDRWSKIAWTATVVSLATLITTLLLPRSLTATRVFDWIGFAAAALFTASLAYLIYRMPKWRNRERDDDGAVV